MSSYSGEAAEQVVRMSLDGAEVAIRLAGSGAKHLAILLYNILKDQKKTRGKIRLTNMLRSGKELKVFGVAGDDLARFCDEAKRYGVLYTVLKDKNASDGFSDVMIRVEDMSKVNRIFQRFGLATVDMTSVRAQVVPEKNQEKEQATKETSAQPAEPERELTQDEKDKAFVDALTTPPEPTSPNPEEGRTLQSSLSEPSSKKKATIERDESELTVSDRPSVRKELEEIRRELKEPAQKDKEPVRSPEHKAPPKKRNKKKEKTRE